MAVGREGCLNLLCDSLLPEERISALDTLLKIVQNAVDHPDVEHFRRLRTENKIFNHRVWRHTLAQEFLTSIGWVLVDDAIVLPSDDLLPDALVEITMARSLCDDQNNPPPPSARNNGAPQTTRDIEYQERMKELREMQRKAREEKVKISERIRSDRQETNQRETKPSHGSRLKFGANLNRFEDIGVDLNAGGG